jgi:protein ImuA
MEKEKSKKDIITKLQKEILLLQGFKPASVADQSIGLGAIETAFPNAVFPTGAIHEFLCVKPECKAASQGFIAGLLNVLMQKDGICLYISRSRNLFPTALYTYGVEPHQIIFVDLERERDVLWAMEEALKCKELAAVVAEIRDISFAQSRRLQLALEKSQVTGFILRTAADRITSTACVARWQITPVESESKDGMPGLGFPRWQVELLRVRNGEPGTWQIEWAANKFEVLTEAAPLELPKRKIG